MMVPRGRRSRARVEEHPGAPREHADHRFEERSRDDLSSPRALAREERELDALRREDPREKVGDRDARARRPAFGGTREAHETAHALRDLIEPRSIAVRPVGPETRD